MSALIRVQLIAWHRIDDKQCDFLFRSKSEIKFMDYLQDE